jgi:rRNA maturation RNase YbeY
MTTDAWPSQWPLLWWTHFQGSATAFFQQKGLTISELIFVFHSDEGLNALNQAHLQHDDFTDIITFDYTRGKRLRGEIHISHERVADNAANLGTTLQDEVFRVMVHGLLHLSGLKDKSTEEALAMRHAEAEFLNFAAAFHVEQPL